MSQETPFKQTPSQTVGPYFAYGLTPEQYGYSHAAIADGIMVSGGTEGERIRVEGRVLDGAGDPVNDAMIELWQANAHGHYNHPEDAREDNLLDPEFSGFGRFGTGVDAENRFIFSTIKPGAAGDGQAPHIAVVVFMRGTLSHAYTRIYFSDEQDANGSDPVLNSVPQDRRQTLIARRDDTPGGPVYRFDIHMQGERETVFFDV